MAIFKKNDRDDQEVVKNPTPSRNPLIRSPIQSRLHPPEPAPEPEKVRRLNIVTDDDDPDPAA